MKFPIHTSRYCQVDDIPWQKRTLYLMKRLSLFFTLLFSALSIAIFPLVSISTSSASLISNHAFVQEISPDGDYEHRVRENEHGIESSQLAIVASAIILAAGLAIGISRRRRP